MAPLELAAAGRPTIAYRAACRGNRGNCGWCHWRSPLTRQEAQAIWPKRNPAIPSGRSGQRRVLRRHAEGFGIDIFQSRFLQFLAQVGAPVEADSTLLPVAAPYAAIHTYEPSLAAVADGVPAW